MFLCVLLLISIFKYRQHQKIELKKQLGYFLCYALALSFFVAFWGTWFRNTESKIATSFVWLLFIGESIYFIFLLKRARGYRLLVLSLFGLFIVLTFWISFVSHMSIWDSWL